MKPLPPCVFPSATEQDVVTVPGTEPCTAYRLRVEPGVAGYLRIEQLAYNQDMGWYTQKSFCLPGDVVHQLMPHLKQASALLPLPTAKSQLATAPAVRNGHTRSMAVSDHRETSNLGHACPCSTDISPLRFPGPTGPGRAAVTKRREA